MNYQEEKRRQSIQQILSIIRKCALTGKECSETKLMSFLAVENGTREETIKNYIEALIRSGHIYREIAEDWRAIDKLEACSSEEECLKRKKLIKEKHMISILKPTESTINELQMQFS